MIMVSTLAVATAHAFVLTVSHGLLFRQPPLTATALLPPLLPISQDCVARRRRRSNSSLFVSDLDSSPNVTRSIDHSSSAGLPVEVQYSSLRAPMNARTYEASRSEHDLNLAILYAVQSGYQRRFFLPDLRCRPLGEIMLRVFRATRRPHSRAIPWPQASRFRSIFQVLFYSPALCRTAIMACNFGLQSRPAFPISNVAHHSWLATFSAINARGTSLRSGCGAVGARPAAVNNAATLSAWSCPNSTATTPLAASSGPAARASTRYQCSPSAPPSSADRGSNNRTSGGSRSRSALAM